jgi:predicted ATPase
VLRKLNLRNFRAFKAQDFHFAKLNIFVGPNNSGKSSAISIINVLAQTINAPELGGTPIIINGQFDSLGTYIDLVHGNRSNTPFGFDIGFDQFEVKIDYKYRQQRREIELVHFELYEGKKQIIYYQVRRTAYTLRVLGNDIEKLMPGGRKRRPIFRGLLPGTAFVNSYLFQKELAQNPGSAEIFRRAERAIMKARMRLRNLFASFDSLSPVRVKPQRTYLYSGETAQKIGTTGGNTAVMLSADASRRGAESRDMSDEISRWFRISGIADQVRIKNLTPRHFEIVVADETGAEHNICDVGFGCSQVLPVLTASLNLFNGLPAQLVRQQPMLVVQEPEIHLHPNAQASLGSFFSGLLQQSGQIFLETHSDNLVLRVARHVADGTLLPGDVKVFYVRRQKGASMVTEIGIAEDGTFTTDWPGGFFPQRQSESLSLAQEAYLAQKRDRGDSQFEFRYPEERR